MTANSMRSRLGSGFKGLSPKLLLALLLLSFSPAAFASAPDEACTLNNEGVKALNGKDMDTAMSKFKLALKKSPGYKLAIDNLAIAYNNSGLACSQDLPKSLCAFHMSVWLTPDNKTSVENLEVLIKRIGKNPASFADRVLLAEDCLRNDDFAGAIVEYQAALKIKNDAAVSKKLSGVKIPEEWRAIKAAHPVVAEADVDFGPYMADLQRRVKRAWFPPRGQESRRVVVLWKIHQDGTVSDLKLDKPCGVKVADDAALEAIKRAAPFRPLPKGAPAAVDIQFSFDYNVFNGGQNSPEQSLKDAVASLERQAKNLPTPVADARIVETKKSVNHAFAWLPYALGGALLSLLIIYLIQGRQNSTIDIAGRNRSGSGTRNS